MAKITKGIIEGFSGRAGTAAGADRHREDTSATAQSGSAVRLVWQDNSARGNALAAGKANAVCHSKDPGTFETSGPVAGRTALTAEVTLPGYYSGKEIHAGYRDACLIPILMSMLTFTRKLFKEKSHKNLRDCRYLYKLNRILLKFKIDSITT